VRELAHEIERAVVFESGDLSFASLARRGVDETGGGDDPWFNASFVFPEEGFSLEQATDRFVEKALAQAGGNVSGAARLLGVTRDFIRYRLKNQSAGN
jgi:DNA-binding NtrC family response regulator